MKFYDTSGYNRIKLRNDEGREAFLVHRIVAQEFIPNPKNKPWVDHINGNRKDNSVDNLRWSTESENGANKITAKNNRLGVKGVTLSKNKDRYVAQHKRIYLGTFDTVEEASEAYKKKAIELFGEFAKW